MCNGAAFCHTAVSPLDARFWLHGGPPELMTENWRICYVTGVPRSSLRKLREAAGLSQAGLASRAGVSRQLVGAVEAGRHLPRVDSALAMAAVLGIDVDALFAPSPTPIDVVSGSVPVDGSFVRAGWVGNRIVSAPARIGPDGWDVADGVIEGGTLTSFGRRGPGLVVAGCEPGLVVLERMLRENGMGAVTAAGSSKVAVEALAAGRVHAAVVHGPTPDALSDPKGVEMDRFRLARWQVGLAASPNAKSGWWREAISGQVPVVQREQGAGVQRTFENAVGPDGASVTGPRVGGHLEAARRAVLTGVPAITIEPAALAVGSVFHALEVHEAQMWVAHDWLGDRSVIDALHVISSPRFQRRLSGVGGYDLTACGTRVA